MEQARLNMQKVERARQQWKRDTNDSLQRLKAGHAYNVLYPHLKKASTIPFATWWDTAGRRADFQMRLEAAGQPRVTRELEMQTSITDLGEPEPCD